MRGGIRRALGDQFEDFAVILLALGKRPLFPKQPWMPGQIRPEKRQIEQQQMKFVADHRSVRDRRRHGQSGMEHKPFAIRRRQPEQIDLALEQFPFVVSGIVYGMEQLLCGMQVALSSTRTAVTGQRPEHAVDNL